MNFENFKEKIIVPPMPEIKPPKDSEIQSNELVELRSKINKAIEEINDIPVLFFEFPLGKAQVIRKDVVIEILKRNLGEFRE